MERRQRPEGKGSEYHLTPAGEELGPVVAQMGIRFRGAPVERPASRARLAYA